MGVLKEMLEDLPCVQGYTFEPPYGEEHLTIGVRVSSRFWYHRLCGADWMPLLQYETLIILCRNNGR